MYDTLRFWTMSCADFLDEYFESEIVKAHLAGSSIIGTALGPRSPGTAYVLLHHYMGSIDGAVGAWGFARGGMGAVTQALAASFQASGGDDPHQRAGRADPGAQRPRRRASCWRTARRSTRRIVVSNLDVKRTFLEDRGRRGPAAGVPRAGAQASRSAAPRASSTSRSTACRTFPAIPQGSPCTRGDMHFTDTHRDAGARLRRLEGRALVARALPRHADPVADRSDHGARRQALHVGVRAVLPVPARRRRLDRRASARPSATP